MKREGDVNGHGMTVLLGGETRIIAHVLVYHPLVIKSLQLIAGRLEAFRL